MLALLSVIYPVQESEVKRIISRILGRCHSDDPKYTFRVDRKNDIAKKKIYTKNV